MPALWNQGVWLSILPETGGDLMAVRHQLARGWLLMGCQWVCLGQNGDMDPAECDYSDGGFEDDLDRIYAEAKAHADKTGHVVYIERMQRHRIHPARRDLGGGA